LTDNGDGTYTYLSEDSTETIINVAADIYNYGDTLLSNDTFVTNLSDTLFVTQNFIDSLTTYINDNETITTLTDNGDGTYTYMSEDSTETIINVAADIYNYGDTLLTNNSFVTNLSDTLLNNNTFITNLSDTLFVTQNFIDCLTTYINDHETITRSTDNGDGTYTYMSEDSTETIINVAADIYNYGDTLLSNDTFVTNLSDTLFVTQNFIDSLTTYINDNETITTLTDNGDGTYTYMSEDSTEIGERRAGTGYSYRGARLQEYKH